MEHIGSLMERQIATVTSTSRMTTTVIGPRSFTASGEWRKKWLRLDEEHPEIQVMAMEAEQFTKRCLVDDCQPRVMVLAGKNGVGKSMTGRAIVSAVGKIGISAWDAGLCPKPPVARSYHWQRLAAIQPGNRQGESLWTEVVELDMVLLDDVGAEVDQFKSGLAAENLRLMLEERRAKWTIVTTNVPPSAWAKAWDMRVEDRLNRNTIIVELKYAPSYLRK